MGLYLASETRFAIIGAGVIGKLHAEQIKKIEGARLVAVADEILDNAKALATQYDADYYTSYHEMLNRNDIDIVNVCTPSGLHGDVTIDVARAGKHVICEKPMDISLAKADAMIQACREAGVKLSVISQHRFDSATVRVKQSIDNGELGRLVMGECAVNWYRSQAYYDSAGWRGTWALDGGGTLMNQSIHTLDLLQHLMGPVDSITAHTDTLAHERIEVEDVAAAVVRFKNGAVGTIACTTCAYPGLSARLEVFGSRGTAVIDADALTHFYHKPEDDTNYDGEKRGRNLAVNDGVDGDGGASNPAAIYGDAHRLQFIDMIEAVRDNRDPLVDGEEGRKPLEIILAIYESSRTGRTVHLPLTLEHAY